MSKTTLFLKKATTAILSIALVMSMAFAAVAYATLEHDYACANTDTMTNMIDPEQQQEISEEIDEEGIGASNDAEESEDASANPSSSSANNSSVSSSDASSSKSSGKGQSNSTGSSNTSGSSSASNNFKTDDKSNSNVSDCKATVYYYEYVNYDDPDAIMVEPGVRFLGERTLDNLKEGQVLNAWNYVVDIPGHIFFDGWPYDLTVTKDPSKNVIKLFYMKLYKYEYTVNYYLMTGADLQADSWSGALAPDDVKFTKMGSETFTDQRFDELIKGDAYEYKLDDMYVIDTYPAQIRLGTDPDNNVINVLYTPTSTNIPDSVPVPDGSDASDGETTPPEGNLPDDETFDKDHLISLLPDDVEVDTQGSNGSGDASAPSTDKPSPDKDKPTDVVIDDFLGNPIDRGDFTVTDDLLTKPISKDQADLALDAYKTGQHVGTLSQTGDTLLPLIWVLIGIAIASAIGLIAMFVRRNKVQQKS